MNKKKSVTLYGRGTEIRQKISHSN